MEIEKLFLISLLSMLVSIAAISWMLYSSHIRNREIVLQRDEIHELQIQKLEIDKLKSIATAEEEQMRRIGRFLHDEVGGNLHVLLQMLEKSNSRETFENSDILSRATLLARKSIESVRMTSQELVPYFLINFGLTRTLQSMADDASEIPGLKVSFTQSSSWSPDLITQESSIQIYRLAQEIYSNVLRHSKPSEISIQLVTTPEVFKLTFIHNGVGMGQLEFEKLLKMGKSLGLKNIEYRARILEANLNYRRYDDSSHVEVAIKTLHLLNHPIA